MPDPDVHINIREPINSGQIFLWENYGNEWFVIDGQDVIMARQTPFELHTLSKNAKNFFREDDKYEKILKNIRKDKIVKKSNCPLPRTAYYKARHISVLHFIHCFIQLKYS